jgi:hypothetical protein
MRTAAEQKRAAVQLETARKSGAVIENDKLIPHPDGKGGLLHHTGFVLIPDAKDPAKAPTIPYRDDPEKGTAIPYRDDHGKQHTIPLQDIRRVTGPDGKAIYHFMVNGKPVSVPEGPTPIFQIAPDGKRFITAADGTRQDLGYDRHAAAQAGIAPREEAANKALQEKLAQGAALKQQLTEKQAQATAAQQRLTAAQQAVAAPFENTGPDSVTLRIRAQEEVIHAEAALKQQQQEVQALQKQHDAHYTALAHEQRARQAEIGRHKTAAAESPADAQWQKDAHSAHGNTRITHLSLIAEAEKKDPASAAAMRQALVPQSAQRLFAAAEKSFGGAQPPAGKSITLHEMLMQAPAMTQDQGTRQRPLNQADAARTTAQTSLGIADPENVRVTRSADGSCSLSRPAADGSGTHQPFATLDPKTNRITLTPGPDGQFSQAAANLAASGSPDGTPIYLPGTQPPLSEAQVSDLFKKGLAATTSTTDRKAADAALTAAGLTPEGISQLVQQGRLSVQDGQLLNNKFNSGVSSYAQRDQAAAARQQEASLQQMQQDAKGTPDKPNFQSWLDKGNPQRDAQVQAKAKELGVSEDQVRRDLETRRIMDWSTPLTQQSHDAQSGIVNGFLRGIGIGGAAESTRTLPDGSIMPHPALGADRAKFDEAIASANGTPEAKAKARELWDQYHDNYLTNLRPALETMETLPGIENYSAWRDRMHQEDRRFGDLTENQKAEKYMAEQKDRNGLVKILDTVSSNLIAGSHDLVSGIVGTAGLLTGSQTLSDYAAEKAGQASRSTAALQYTGSDGLLHNVIGGLSRALPGLAATAATGGTAGAATMAFVQGAGSTYTDLYQDGINKGLSPAEAHKAAAGPAIASGAVSAALGKIMPGGTQALNNPATLEAAKKSFGTIVKSALQGAKDEVKEELIDSGFNHIATEMSKGKTFQQAATSYAEQFPQSALTAALLGGGMQATADQQKGGDPAPQQPATVPQQPIPQPATPGAPASASSPGQPPQTSPSTPSQQPARVNPPATSQQPPIPQRTTPDAEASGSGQQPQTTANDGKQPQTSPPSSGQQSSTTVDNSQPPSTQPSPQQPIPHPTTLDTPASGSSKPPQTPSPSGSGQQPQTTANDSKPSPTPTASGSAQKPQTTANDGKQPQTSPPAPSLPPPTTAPKSPEQSQRLVKNVMNRPPEQRGHPQVQSDLAQAQDVLKDHVQKLENQKEPLTDAQKKELADARATLSRLPSEKPANTTENNRPPESANRPQPETQDSATRPHSEADPGAPPDAVDLNRAPLTDPDAEAPRRRGDSDAQTHPAETQPDGARPTRTLPGDAAFPHGYDSTPTPPSSRNSPDGRALEHSYPSPARNGSPAINATGTTPYHPATSAESPDTTNAQTAARPTNENAPDQGQNVSAKPNTRPTDNSRPPTPNSQETPQAATTNVSPPSSPSRTSLPPPRTPPLSPEQSQRLLDNVAKMPAKAQQHPQVLADVAQAQGVVARVATKTINGDDSIKASHSKQGPELGPNIKSFEERQTENSDLLINRPRRNSPFSDKATTITKGVFGQVLRKVALLCDHAHDDGTAPPVEINDDVQDLANDGEYRPSHDPKSKGLASVKPGIFDPLMTGAHELGHHIAKHVLSREAVLRSREAVLRIRDVARGTSAWERIIKRNKSLKYFTDPEEVFCRAYSQLVAQRSGDPEMLAELDKTLKDPLLNHTQWDAHDFARLQKALEQELKKIGWL